MHTNCHKFLSILLGLSTLAINTFPSMANTPSTETTSRTADYDRTCGFHGTWVYPGTGGAFVLHLRNKRNVTIMLGIGKARPTRVEGKINDDSKLEAKFPEGTLTGTLDGNGNLNWSNGTVWQSNPIGKNTHLSGLWRHEGQDDFLLTRHVGDGNFDLTIAKRGQQKRTGNGRGSQLTMQFPGGTLNGTLVTPTCIRWSNNTTWIRVSGSDGQNYR
jgi:hypothetical protein